MHQVIYERAIYLRDGQPYYVSPWRETSESAADTLSTRALTDARTDVLLQIARVCHSDQPSVFEGR